MVNTGRNLLIAVTTAAALLPPAVAAPVASAADAAAVIRDASCYDTVLPANDDNSSTQVMLPFGINFYGETFTELYVNNNGNVTFDAPLSTYTPFGLAGTGRQIIAPYFGDVDTRPSGSDVVRYGYGETVYQGQRAFCVLWDNVGYYNNHADKLNSFQLLIVERRDSGPGSFDIVFNYDQVQWESGDASGGQGGLGGSTARAGFSNGSGEPGTSFEMPGSGEPGALLDSAAGGLANTSTDSSVTGRHVFRVRGGAAPATDYVALGDSYQSGEGAGAYSPETDSDSNKCHRSLYAYPQVLVSRALIDIGPQNLRFWACSGARTYDMYQAVDVDTDDSDVPFDDGYFFDLSEPVSYLDRLSTSTRLVTIGIGGNDMGFGKILAGCVLDGLGDALIPFHDSSCQGEYADEVAAAADSLLRDPDAQGRNKLEQVYAEIRRRAPYARVAVLGYPKFYVDGGRSNGYDGGYCAGVRIADQRWINQEITNLNAAIADAAQGMGLQFVDVFDAPDGHELCGDSDEHFLNGVELSSEAYHPNRFGHSLLADTIATALGAPAQGELFNVHPGETLRTVRQVRGGSPVTFATNWPGSDVVMTLTAPSGRRYTRTSVPTGVIHEVGPTFERYEIESPEAGEWTVELLGAQVAEQGEPTQLIAYQPPQRNSPPTAVVAVSQSGREVTVDGAGSADPDGQIVDYLWEFGDGTQARGSAATHEYQQPGDYLVTLSTTDDSGDYGTAAARSVVTIPRYEFDGFFAPVANAPEVNAVKAGQAIPVKFSLGGAYGLDILALGSPTSVRTSCSTGNEENRIEPTALPGGSGLTYDAGTGRYTYVWKTAKSWSGQCRRFTLALDDGTVKTFDLELR